MLARRHRRRPNIKTAADQASCLLGWPLYYMWPVQSTLRRQIDALEHVGKRATSTIVLMKSVTTSF